MLRLVGQIGVFHWIGMDVEEHGSVSHVRELTVAPLRMRGTLEI
jgi:hypothetical protein